MDQHQKDINRNRPADAASDTDPKLRDHSGQQPGTSTMSKTDHDELNHDLTRTSKDNYRQESFGEDADPAFDDEKQQ